MFPGAKFQGHAKLYYIEDDSFNDKSSFYDTVACESTERNKCSTTIYLQQFFLSITNQRNAEVYLYHFFNVPLRQSKAIGVH